MRSGLWLAKDARARVAPLIDRLVRRAQASGSLRSDVVASDVPLLQFIVSSVAELTGPNAPELWRRYLALVLDGLRTPDPHPLPQLGLSLDELDAAARKARVRSS